MSDTLRPDIDVEKLKLDVADLLGWCLYQLDNKPHHLFSQLRNMAVTYVADDDLKRECIKMADIGYINASRLTRDVPLRRPEDCDVV